MKDIGNDPFRAEELRLEGKKVYYRLNSGSSREWNWTEANGPIPENMTDFDWAVEDS